SRSSVQLIELNVDDDNDFLHSFSSDEDDEECVLFDPHDEVTTFQSAYSPSQDELLLLPTCSSTDSFLSLQRFKCGKSIICTEEYNREKAKTTLNHCIKTLKNKFFIVNKIIKTKSNDTYFFVKNFSTYKKFILHILIPL